jgi:hypothetical protein
VQQPYNLRCKRGQNQAQLKGKKVKSSFEKLLSSSERSDEDFDVLEPVIHSKNAGEQESSDDEAGEPADSIDQGDETITINSTDHIVIEPTITIHSTIVIDSTASDSNPSPIPPDACRAEAETAARGAVQMVGLTAAADLSSGQETTDRLNLNSPNTAKNKRPKATRSHPPSLDISYIEPLESASFEEMARNESSSRDLLCQAAEPSTSTPKEGQHQQAE